MLPVLQEALALGITITVHTKTADSYEADRQKDTDEAISTLERIGVAMTLHKELQLRFAIMDESTVWYGNVDLLTFASPYVPALIDNIFHTTTIAGSFLFSGILLAIIGVCYFIANWKFENQNIPDAESIHCN